MKKVLLVGVLAVMSGCTNALSPPDWPTTRFRGHVRLDGRPIGPGWLEILPTGGARGVLRSAPVEADGSFRVDGVPVGTIAIRLAGRPLPRTGDNDMDRYLFAARRMHTIRMTTQADNPPVDIDLREHRYAFERIYGTQY